MQLKLVRKYFSEKATVGELYINDKLFCNILEDVDRALDSKTMTKERISWLKQKAITAIPYGTYEIIISFSERFQSYLPLLLAVPGYEGIRIHPGNKHTDTEGCLLPGEYNVKLYGPDFVGKSKLTFESLFKELQRVEKKEKIFITITQESVE